MKILITGGCGFLGSNLASYGLNKNNEITIFDNLSRRGTEENLKWLESLGNVNFIYGDIRSKNDVDILIKDNHFDAVFHLAAQVTMVGSIENPYKDFEVNALGTVNLLDSINKYSKNTIVVYTSTNKVYGDLEQYQYTETESRFVCTDYPNGFPEEVPLDFHSPYGCSKGAADQYMLDFARIYGIKTVVFRHSSMYGSRQFANYDQGWIGWFCQKAMEIKKDPNIKPFTICGNGKQVRDILHGEDVARLYYSALENIDNIYGQAFNIGGTMNQSLSLLELFDLLEEYLGIKMKYVNIPVRESDQRVFVADISKINKAIGWKPEVNSKDGIYSMIAWINEMNHI